MIVVSEVNLERRSDSTWARQPHGVCKILHVATLPVAWQRYPMAVPRPRLGGEAAIQAPLRSALKKRGMIARHRSAHDLDSSLEMGLR